MRLRTFLAVAALAGVAACGAIRQQLEGEDSPAPRAPPTAAAPLDFPAFAYAPLTPPALMAHVERLASDEFGGRAPVTHGETLTVDYIARAFAAAGLRPGVPTGGRPVWEQSVPLVTSTIIATPTLTLGGQPLRYGDDFVVWSRRREPHIALDDAELIFVGYGIVAPELGWNDYAGLDMNGKIALILVNDPDFETGDDRGFDGRAMTYHGRWTYKFEEAARQGAAGALIVHETAAAAYPWSVVRSSWSGPQHDLDRDSRSQVAVEGWITQEAAHDLFARAGRDLAAERARAQQAGFAAEPLGLSGDLTLYSQIDARRSRNVIGVLPGRSRADEAVIIGAHWDHLGRCAPVDGDSICNGALDNATGVAGLIELARRFAEGGRRQRSVAFIAFTAEEWGLLGSEHYADHPVFPLATTAAMINLEGLSIHGPARDVMVVGSGRNDLEAYLAEVVAAQQRRIAPEAFPEQGGFYRSDHFSFARLGVPVLYARAGVDLYEGGVARGRALSDAYIAEHYHAPSDEFSPEWDMTGAMRDLQLLYEVAARVADTEDWPDWRPNDEYRAVRDVSRAAR